MDQDGPSWTSLIEQASASFRSQLSQLPRNWPQDQVWWEIFIKSRLNSLSGRLPTTSDIFMLGERCVEICRCSLPTKSQLPFLVCWIMMIGCGVRADEVYPSQAHLPTATAKPGFMRSHGGRISVEIAAEGIGN